MGNTTPLCASDCDRIRSRRRPGRSCGWRRWRRRPPSPPPLFPPPPPQPDIKIATAINPTSPRRRRQPTGSNKTHASTPPPPTTIQALLTELLLVPLALIVIVAVVFPLTVIDPGFNVQLNPVGALHVKATDELNPLIAPRASVAVPLAPEATVTVGVCATREKSDKGLLSDTSACDGAKTASPEYVTTTALLPRSSEAESR